MNHEDKIQEIMDWFDFNQVHKAMLALGWKWVMPDEDKARTPEIAEIRQEARRLLRLVAGKPDGYETACGGLRATSLGPDLRLTFGVSEWQTT